MEKVGKVMLCDTWYPGEDLYSDGKVEDEMLETAKEIGSGSYDDVIAQKRSWPYLYHFSPLRTNIITWLPVTGQEEVLEIGSGCGAMSGALASMAGHVDCIELSKKRSLINAWRNQDKENLQIYVGNYQEIAPNLEKKYDYITLIGVLEYAAHYIQGENPYVTFLQEIAQHLKPDGKVIVAIENKFGLKYWGGSKEDHTGRYFEGLEGYHKSSGVRTFSKTELEELIASSGMKIQEFRYPYPDYKFPEYLYSDEYLPKPGELFENRRNFDFDRIALFDENSVFDEVIKGKLFPEFSNSFLVVLEKGEKK